MSWLVELYNTGLGFADFLQDGDTQDAIKGLAKSIEDNAESIKDILKEKTADQSGGFLGVPWFENDFWKLVFKFTMNISVILIIVRLIYYPIAKRKDYLFTYIMISLVIFMICFTLKKFEMGMGMALGLFAIFGIIRYRTDAIPIKEMTYLFIVIGISVINALSNKKMSYAELAFTNAAIIAVTWGLERLWLLKHESLKIITFEKIDLITPDKHSELLIDLEKRTGLKIDRFEIGKINFLNDTAQISIFYHEDKQIERFQDEGI